MLAIELNAEQRVVMRGRLDASQTGAAQAFLDKLDGPSRVLTIDCAALDYVASAGLGVLLKTHKRLLTGGGRLRLANPSPHLREILGYSGFDHIFEIDP